MPSTPSSEGDKAANAICSLTSTMDSQSPQLLTRKQTLIAQLQATPKTSIQRRQVSARTVDSQQSLESEDTVLYLGYGSNLAAETFLGKRGIRPLSQTNVVVPSIHLTFDLPGVPYSEPCFGNCRYRLSDEKPSPDHPPYHKNAWKKGLVGVVYEVTKEDYAHIIATEGGGSSYHDLLVDCYALPDDPTEEVPLHPTGTPFKAHTLYAQSDRIQRPDPDYAQPSARYLKLILDGAEQHRLPDEYRHFLTNIRSYQTTTTAQRLGSFIFLAIWGPILLSFFTSSKAFARPDGTYPDWFAKFARALFTTIWNSYDNFFFPLFGDGERTAEGDSERDEQGEGLPVAREISHEKTPLLMDTKSRISSVV